VALDWSDNVEPGVGGYHVYRSSAAAGPFIRVNATLLATSAFDDTTAPEGAVWYRVTAVNPAAGESAPSPVVSTTVAVNRIVNPSFEAGTSRPDGWTSSSNVARSDVGVRSGSFSMRHRAGNNATYTITQNVPGLAAGATYALTGWVNVPTTNDAFSFQLQVRWRNGSTNLRTDTVGTVSTSTDWTRLTSNLVAPAGTTNADVLMVVSSLKATIYVDDLALR
jgi:hypothetical protein